ncbi:MAG: DUF2116 family Zn-ribbon domain-containing protein [Clostridia bacterium]|nr:DUF2116 family Zn-ribbon domain-containing protein [Clostridia bacterium]
MICPFCGEVVRENAYFCSSCGKKINVTPEEKARNKKMKILAIAAAVIAVIIAIISIIVPKSTKCDSCGKRFAEDTKDYSYIATHGVCSKCYTSVWEDFWLG